MTTNYGVVRKFFPERGFGFIEPEAGGLDLFFHNNNMQDRASAPRVDDRVAYEERPGRRGTMEAFEVALSPLHLRETPSSRPPDDLQVRHGGVDDVYRFLNPYNFVRYLEKPRPLKHLLGNCAPPSHDRYVGLTGKLICKIQNVSPLFISDSHGVGPDKEHPGHNTYQFFQIKNDQGIPIPTLAATSLRGMLRSVFEAATSSCFSVFERDEEKGKSDRLEYRSPRDPGIIPARVIDVNAAGAKLETFDCTRMAPPFPCTETRVTIRCGMVSAYHPVVSRRHAPGAPIPFTGPGIVTTGFEDGERAADDQSGLELVNEQGIKVA